MRFLALFALSRIKWCKLGSFGTKLGTEHYFIYVIVLKFLESKTKIVICLKLRAKLHFWMLFSVFGISRIKWFKLGLFDTKHGTQHYLAYVFLLKWLATKNINIYLKLCAKLRFWGFFSIFCTFSKKVVQTWFVWHETRHTNYLVYFFVLKWLELISIVICLKLRAKFLF